MDIISFSFLGFALLAIAVLRLVRNASLRTLAVLLLNALFVSSFIHQPRDVLPVILMLLLGYAAITAAAHKPSRWKLGLLIAALVATFAVLKQYSVIAPLLPTTMPVMMVVGLSYILFRQLHLLIDVAQGARTRPAFLPYLNYCLFFATFLTGPIARYEHMEHQLATPPAALSVSELHAAVLRILLGVMLVVFFSAYAATMVDFITSTRSLATPNHEAWVKTAQLFSLTCFATLIKLYCNFSGSMHILLGLGKLCGITLPENFNKPYLAKNFLDFWARWHITLSEWIKYYLFNPLLAALTRRYPSARASTAIGAIAFFVSFFVIGMWHGSSSAFAIFALMLGTGAVANKLWQQGLSRWLGKSNYKELARKNWYFQISRGLTLAYIALSLICLWMPSDYIAVNGAGWVLCIMALSLVFMAIGLAALGALADALASWLRPLTTGWHAPRSEAGMVVLTALVAWVVFNHIGAFGSGTPELVYKGF